jgi:hypothetical protein
MNILRLAVPAVVAAAALAGCYAYFVAPPLRVEAEEQPTPTAPDAINAAAAAPVIGKRRTAEDFERAAEAILKRLPDVQASVLADGPPIIGHVPLPKRRPIPR